MKWKMKRTHNPKVVSSSLTPATIEKQTPIYGVCFFYHYDFLRLELSGFPKSVSFLGKGGATQ